MAVLWSVAEGAGVDVSLCGGVGNVSVAENGTTVVWWTRTTAAVVDPDSGGVNASGEVKRETPGWSNSDR